MKIKDPIFYVLLYGTICFAQKVINNPFHIVRIDKTHIQSILSENIDSSKIMVRIYLMVENNDNNAFYRRDSLAYDLKKAEYENIINNIDSINTKYHQSCFDGYGLHGLLFKDGIKLDFTCDDYSECGYNCGQDRVTIYFNKEGEKELIRLFRNKRNLYLKKNGLNSL